MPALKARISAGLATETIVESTRIMKNPRTSAHSAGHASLGTTTSLGGAEADAASWVVTSASAMRGLLSGCGRAEPHMCVARRRVPFTPTTGISPQHSVPGRCAQCRTAPTLPHVTPLVRRHTAYSRCDVEQAV